MQRNWWPAVVFVVLTCIFAGSLWPLPAQSPDAKGGDALAQIDKRLERIEKMLAQQQHEMKATHPPKGPWQRIEGLGDKDPYVVILNCETGKVRFLDLKAANVYEK